MDIDAIASNVTAICTFLRFPLQIRQLGLTGKFDGLMVFFRKEAHRKKIVNSDITLAQKQLIHPHENRSFTGTILLISRINLRKKVKKTGFLLHKGSGIKVTRVYANRAPKFVFLLVPI